MKTHTTTLKQHRQLIEKYAVLTERASDLRGKLDEWYACYQPATPGECELLDLAVMASTLHGRVMGSLTQAVNDQIRSAVFDFDCDQEDELDRLRAMLETEPGRAVLGLKRFALGVRFLITRWDRLLRLLRDEGTLYGNDRDEMIHYQGARATKPENLFECEGAYMVWLFCLMCQPKPKDADLVHIGNIKFMPTALDDRPMEQWAGTAAHCRKLLEELAEAELRFLRAREALLRTNYDTPKRDGAEVRRQVLTGPLGAQLIREAETHERQYLRAYQAFVRGRAQAVKTGMPPGISDPSVQGGMNEVPTDVPEPEPDGVAAAAAQRRQAADALAPGEENGIGVAIFRGDAMRAAVLATNPMSMEEYGRNEGRDRGRG